MSRVAAMVLAAGQSNRAGSVNKLLAQLDGKAMIARVVDAVCGSAVTPVVVVIGYEHQHLEAALRGRSLRFVRNPAYAKGLSTSLRCGIEAMPDDASGVLVCLGDMPGVRAHDLGRLIAAFDPCAGRAICVPTFDGKRGNPVLLAKRFFAEMEALEGDAGARRLIDAHHELVWEVEMDNDGVLRDIDTVEALQAFS